MDKFLKILAYIILASLAFQFLVVVLKAIKIYQKQGDFKGYQFNFIVGPEISLKEKEK